MKLNDKDKSEIDLKRVIDLHYDPERLVIHAGFDDGFKKYEYNNSAALVKDYNLMIDWFV